MSLNEKPKKKFIDMENNTIKWDFSKTTQSFTKGKNLNKNNNLRKIYDKFFIHEFDKKEEIDYEDDKKKKFNKTSYSFTNQRYNQQKKNIPESNTIYNFFTKIPNVEINYKKKFKKLLVNHNLANLTAKKNFYLENNNSKEKPSSPSKNNFKRRVESLHEIILHQKKLPEIKSFTKLNDENNEENKKNFNEKLHLTEKKFKTDLLLNSLEDINKKTQNNFDFKEVIFNKQDEISPIKKEFPNYSSFSLGNRANIILLEKWFRKQLKKHQFEEFDKEIKNVKIEKIFKTVYLELFQQINSECNQRAEVFSLLWNEINEYFRNQKVKINDSLKLHQFFILLIKIFFCSTKKIFFNN